MTAAVALGANLGDRAAAITDAAARLLRAAGKTLRLSTLYETAAVTAPGSPTQPPYLNAAAVFETSLPARDLLDLLLSIERSLGRERAPGEKWGARTIDLDLLLYGDAVLDEPGLVVPHPRMHERAFVLGPLAEVAPELVHPIFARTVRELRDAIDA